MIPKTSLPCVRTSNYYRFSNPGKDLSLHLGSTKNFFKYLSKNKKNCAMLDRSIPTREALVHSIPISEVKDIKSDVLRALKTSLSKKSFEPCLQAQF
jgi:hypothetical protein